MNSYVPPNLQHRKGKLLAPNQAGLSLNSHYKKSFCWLKSFFRFGTENGKEKLKTAWRKIGEKKQNICFWEWVSEKHWRRKIICQMRRRRKTPRIWCVHKNQHYVRNKCMKRFNMRVTSFSVGIKCLKSAKELNHFEPRIQNPFHITLTDRKTDIILLS